MPAKRRSTPRSSYHRIVVYIEKDGYPAFKEKLTANGLTVSSWVRKNVRAVMDGGRP